jgi:predicted DNA-binding ArsR family transcriptional regulator
VTGHVRIVNDPIEIVPLIVTFNNKKFKEIYELLNKNWLTEDELIAHTDAETVADCLAILKKGNLIEEQWRMPKPGAKPAKEFRTTYSKVRANFQCSMSDLSDLLHIAVSTNEHLRLLVDQIEAEISNGNTSINDMARKLSCNTTVIKGLAKRIPRFDVKGQTLILVERNE